MIDPNIPPEIEALTQPAEILPHPPKVPTISLTPEQNHAVDLISTFVSDDPRDEFNLGGYAGTGKTTIIRYILESLSKQYRIKVSAFTGKACNVLQRKGIPSQTLHSLLYDVVEDPKTHEISFERKPSLVDNPDLIIVDEASMVSVPLYDELKSCSIKYLFVGDPGQLEPVGDNPNLMKRTDFVLSHIHRQAATSPIISLANSIRNGGSLIYQSSPGLTVRKKEISSPEFLSCDQVIVAKNKTRQDFNSKIRSYLKLPLREVVPTDKLICLRNNLNLGVYNGMILKVKEILSCNGFFWLCLCEDETGKEGKYPIWCEPIRDPSFDTTNARVLKNVVYCDFGYAITCHKAQGSEWDKVLIWREWMPPQIWDMKRWDYTAITRAAKELIVNV